MSKRLGNYPGACLTEYYLLLILPENFKCIFSGLLFGCILLVVHEEIGKGSSLELSRLDKIAHILEEIIEVGRPGNRICTAL